MTGRPQPGMRAEAGHSLISAAVSLIDSAVIEPVDNLQTAAFRPVPEVEWWQVATLLTEVDRLTAATLIHKTAINVS